MRHFLSIRGAREHNLKNVDLDLPLEKLIVITGLSGSGKSSLAFDIIYAEGRRRYVESLSSYARQFLGNVGKPDVDSIDGLSPAIAIQQKSVSKNPRSTLATVTEIYDYMRVLFSRLGTPKCPNCSEPIKAMSAEQISSHILKRAQENAKGSKAAPVWILTPLAKGKKGEHVDIFEKIRSSGFVRVRVDGKTLDLDEVPRLAKTKRHTIEAVVDRILLKGDVRSRLVESVEHALALGGGQMAVMGEGNRLEHYSSQFSCAQCGFGYEEISPRLFSFNSPYGACPHCMGIGKSLSVDPAIVVDVNRSLSDGAIRAHSWAATRFIQRAVLQMAPGIGASTAMRFKDLSADVRKIILYGSGDEELRFVARRGGELVRYRAPFEGIIPFIERRFRESEGEGTKTRISQLMAERVCARCHGERLKPESLAVFFQGRNISQLTHLTVSEALAFFDGVELNKRDQMIGERVIKEIRSRLFFLQSLGLSYLSLDRTTGTLAGGESQRIQLATQIGSGLRGVLYVLDEPSVGLHQRDNGKLLKALSGLRDLGNTVIVVEHDEATIRAADYVVDLGPGAGIHGGKVVAKGTPRAIQKIRESHTGQYLSGTLSIEAPAKRRTPEKWLELKGVTKHNLKKLNVKIPLGCLVGICGVSGSGKSSLVVETLLPALRHEVMKTLIKPKGYRGISGWENVDKILEIDQSAIGRTPRSNPATYTGAFTPIRELFAATPESQVRGYRPGRFSFNVRGGRCEACEGDGVLRIEMHFLPDVFIPCDSCDGRRYNKETRKILYKGKSIDQVLDLSLEEASHFFKNQTRIQRIFQTLVDVGLGYVKLGQSATTLSGGEAQRVKLASELSRVSTGKTFYVLDEPTTGLHIHDIQKLMVVLQRLVDAGNTVVVIEHQIDVLKCADYLIDLGPEGGDAGGTIVVEGAPEDIASSKISHTGKFLKKVLRTGKRR